MRPFYPLLYLYITYITHLNQKKIVYLLEFSFSQCTYTHIQNKHTYHMYFILCTKYSSQKDSKDIGKGNAINIINVVGIHKYCP